MRRHKVIARAAFLSSASCVFGASYLAVRRPAEAQTPNFVIGLLIGESEESRFPRYVAGINAAISESHQPRIATEARLYRSTNEATLKAHELFDRGADVIIGVAELEAAINVARIANEQKKPFITFAASLQLDVRAMAQQPNFVFRFDANLAMRSDAVAQAARGALLNHARLVIVGKSSSATTEIYETLNDVVGSVRQPEIVLPGPGMDKIPPLQSPNQFPGPPQGGQDNLVVVLGPLDNDAISLAQGVHAKLVLAPTATTGDAIRLPNKTVFGSVWQPKIGPDEAYYLGYTTAKDVLARFRKFGRRDLRPADFEDSPINDGKSGSRWRKADHQAVQEIYALQSTVKYISSVSTQVSFELLARVPADARAEGKACTHCTFESCGVGHPCTTAKPK